MSFLDNLENNLKAMESQEDSAPARRWDDEDDRARAAAAARAAAPYAEQLRTGPFTQSLLGHCRAIGHGMRVLVRIVWMGETLRLDAKERRMELAPTTEGVRATFSEDGEVVGSELVDLGGDPESLARRWLS